MSKNTNLIRAKAAKNDEYYTRIVDIENELKHYKKHLKNKTILMPCDDPELIPALKNQETPEMCASQFWVFFHKQFSHLKLKKIIATHYDKNGGAYGIEYSGGSDNNIFNFKRFELKGDGNFRSEEINELMLKSDIVITNPPFSLIKEFAFWLINAKKDFLIVAPYRAATYGKFFPYFVNIKIMFGHTNIKKFMVITKNNKTLLKSVKTRWWTNIKTDANKKELHLFAEYDKNRYKNVDSYDAIMINKVKEIPKNYFGNMAVPITYMDFYNPKLFKIISLDETKEFPGTYIDGERKFTRIIIKRKSKK